MEKDEFEKNIEYGNKLWKKSLKECSDEIKPIIKSIIKKNELLQASYVLTRGNREKAFKAQILKEEKRKVCRHLIICNDVLEGRTCSEIQEALKQNNQRNSVGVPVSKKETENPLSGLSDDDITAMGNGYSKAIDLCDKKDVENKWKRRLRTIKEEWKGRKQLSNQESNPCKNCGCKINTVEGISGKTHYFHPNNSMICDCGCKKPEIKEESKGAE